MSQTPVRLLAVWVPDWPLVALALDSRARPGSAPDPALAPVAVTGPRGVLAASAAARRVGVVRGMRLRAARSLCPELIVVPTRPERETRAFEEVMEALSTILAEPVVARPGLALSAARGPARWLGSEEAVAAGLVEAVASGPGAECQVGIADSFLAAVLAARAGVIVPAGQARTFLAPAPLRELVRALPEGEQTEDLLTTLERLGVRTLGDLARLPAAEVTARFGPLGQRAHRLASAQAWRVPSTERPVADLSVDADLDPPAQRADTAAFAARALAESLVARLGARGLAAGRLQVAARCANDVELVRSWTLQDMTGATEVTDRVRWQLEAWLAGRAGRPPASPVTHLTLTALDLLPAAATQAGLWSAAGRQGRRRAHRAAARVESLLGAGSVLEPHLGEGRDPRSRVSLLPWGQGPQPASDRQAPQAPAWSGTLVAPWPSLVLADPVPARLQDSSGREIVVDNQGLLVGDPAVVTVERAGGNLPAGGPVRSWGGPWPVDEGWWRPEGASRRAYLQVRTEVGPPLLLVRSGRWWLDAVYS